MTDPRPWAGRRLHLVGIGGIGMSGIAEALDTLAQLFEQRFFED